MEVLEKLSLASSARQMDGWEASREAWRVDNVSKGWFEEQAVAFWLLSYSLGVTTVDGSAYLTWQFYILENTIGESYNCRD